MVAFVYLANVGLLQYCHGAGLATISQGGNAIDHIGFQVQAQQAVDNLTATDTVTRAYGIQLWVATAPPSRFPAPLQAWQAEFNRLVTATFCRVIDFTTGFDTLLEPDGLHVTAAGQALRAERVRTALSTRDCP